MYLNLERLCFSVPYALCIEKNDKKGKKSPTCLPKFFENITSNTHIFLLDLVLNMMKILAIVQVKPGETIIKETCTTK